MFLEGCIERQLDILLTELQDHLLEVCDVEVSTATITRTLYRRGFSRKKVRIDTFWYVYIVTWFQVTRPAIERDENNRAAFKLVVGEHFRADQLIFADESHFNWITLRRPYAWAPRGNRARRRDFKFKTRGRWCLGEFLEGHEYLALFPVSSFE
jgi:hypothetical protein